MRRAAVLFVLLVCSISFAQSTQPTTASADLSDAELLQLVHNELGPLYTPVDDAKYLAGHALLESYFAESSSKDHAKTEADLAQVGLNPNVLGRVCRIRRHWQEFAPGVYYINQAVNQYDLKYFLGIPTGYTRMKSWPLVILLPPADAFVTNPPPDSAAVAKIYQQWITDELARQKDAVVIVPLLNLDELYGPSRAGMNTVIQPMFYTAELANIDPQQVYLTGFSMGAHATWNIALHYPTYFASIAPFAGAASADWQRLRLMNLRNILPVVWHDSEDPVIPFRTSASIVSALRGLKLDVEFIQSKTGQHAPPPQMIDQVFKAMRARLRDLYPTEVFIQSNKPETPFNRADWVQMYQPMRQGAEKRLQLTRGTGPMIVYDNAFNIKATLAKNRVTASTDNVEVMRFYFNDQMIDFRRAVSVVVNGRVKFEGELKPDLDTMLKDQTFMGRGWRYFTAFVDVDFGIPPATKPTTRP